MGSSIGFYCGPLDIGDLESFARSIDLHLIAPRMDAEDVLPPENGPFRYLSVVPKSELHPFGMPPVNITDARDPIMRFMRGYFENPYLVAGHLYWSNDVRPLAAVTKPYFEKLRRWIKGRWERLPGGGFYIGPEAKALVSKGATMVNVLPGSAESHIVQV
jgi:hypothetical protein